MRKIKLYIAISLNGMIAKKNGSVEWLESQPVLEGEDYGYHDFYASIDTTIMGNATYQQIVNWDIEFPYKGKKNYVLTSNSSLEDNEDVQFISKDHIYSIRSIKEENGKDIWLIGGGKANKMLIDAGLIDQIYIHIMPYILDDGIPLFHPLMSDVPLHLVHSKTYSTGVLEMIYEVQRISNEG